MNLQERGRRPTKISSFREAVHPKTDLNTKGVKMAHICLEYMSLNL